MTADPFTDDALTIVRAQLATCEKSPSSMPLGEMVVAVGYAELKALVQRLEAAEECMDGHRGDCLGDLGRQCSCAHDENFEAWRKASGHGLKRRVDDHA